jgi:hypothetical protein
MPTARESYLVFKAGWFLGNRPTGADRGRLARAKLTGLVLALVQAMWFTAVQRTLR